MHTFVKRQVAWIWIALLGVLFSALAPTISHAMAASQTALQASQTVQVCTAEGVVSLAVDRAQPGKPAVPAPDHIFKHCPCCAAHGGAPALPSAPRFLFPLIRQATAYPALFYRSAAPLFAWRAANPRAPPATA